MNKTISWLAILLAAQLALAAGLYWGSQGDNFEALGESLLTTDTSLADKLVFSSPDASVTLAKKSDAWSIPEYHDLPVNNEGLDTLLSKLGELQAGWPVANSSAAQARFEVAEDKFEKRMQLFRGDELLADIYVGTSPAYRRAHIRLAGATDIFSVELNAHDVYVKNEEWLDKALLVVSDLNSVKGADYTLQKQDDAWSLVPEPVEDALPLNTDQVEKLADTLSGLRIQTASDSVDGEATMVSIGKATGDTLDYALFQQGEDYWVKRSDQAVFFSITKSDFETLTQANLAWLTEEAPEVVAPAMPPAGMIPGGVQGGMPGGLPQGMSMEDLPPEVLEALRRQQQQR